MDSWRSLASSANAPRCIPIIRNRVNKHIRAIGLNSHHKDKNVFWPLRSWGFHHRQASNHANRNHTHSLNLDFNNFLPSKSRSPKSVFPFFFYIFEAKHLFPVCCMYHPSYTGLDIPNLLHLTTLTSHLICFSFNSIPNTHHFNTTLFCFCFCGTQLLLKLRNS